MKNKNEELKKMVINHIEYHTGIKFDLCKEWSEIKKIKGCKYINIKTKTNNRFNSDEWLKLERCANNSSIINRIEPNGYERVAIILNKLEESNNENV